MHLRLGLEPTCWDLNPAKTHSLPTDITHLVLGLKLRFLMSHCRKNSVRDKVIGKKWIYLERNTPQTECGPSQKVRKAPGYGVVSFYRGG